MASIFSSQFWSNLFNSDLAIDLGTASTLIHTKQAGRIVIYEPSIVAVNTLTHEVEAVGDEVEYWQTQNLVSSWFGHTLWP